MKRLLRDEALAMLDKQGAILETAQKISDLLRDNQIKGAIIGGVAVVLHGHLRTTKDVDVWIADSLNTFGHVLEGNGASFDRKQKEFLLDTVPVHLVPNDMAVPHPTDTTEIDGVLTIPLPDLINLKLTSGLKRVTRAQDLADVIGLIRERRLTSAFATRLHKSVRAEFRKLVKAVQSE
jgi:hypothetical protein